MQRLIAVDLDGTLTVESCWTEEECLIATPRKDMIDYVNKLYNEREHIVIWTARRDCLRHATEYWLSKNGVHYHTLDMSKLPAHLYIDDKAINSLDTKEVIKYVDQHEKGGDIKLINMLR
jgi:uncharacterized HAD superfamily protein